jgi:hypothetical protein
MALREIICFPAVAILSTCMAEDSGVFTVSLLLLSLLALLFFNLLCYITKTQQWISYCQPTIELNPPQPPTALQCCTCLMREKIQAIHAVLVGSTAYAPKNSKKDPSQGTALAEPKYVGGKKVDVASSTHWNLRSEKLTAFEVGLRGEVGVLRQCKVLE